ncbi:MAG TPA: bifunctional metallophosphatase/5'-nucleotidase [Chloroflexi bacterium]|nr:bifunctional metallophosphatase/5'-nucleotidase [Chloroflexota bacterium]
MSSHNVVLTILHTNDLHARIERLPFLSAMVRRIRAEVAALGGHTLLWDAGDAEDRILLESDVTKGAAIAAILNAMGYDAAALGNSAAPTYGPASVARIAQVANYPILAANLVWSQTGQLVEGLRPFLEVALGPIRLGIIGVTATSNAYSLFGARSYPPEPIVAELASYLRQRGATLIAVLSHLGLEADRHLAQVVEGIDLIVGGHSHDLLEEPLDIGGTLITQAGCYGSHLGRIDLEVDVRSGRVLGRQARLLPVDIAEADARVIRAIEEQNQAVQQLLSRYVGHTVYPLDINYFQECAMGNLLADVLRERMDAEIAFVATGMLDEAIREGPITFGDLCRATSSTANPARAELRGQGILDALNYGLRPEVSQERPAPLRGNPQGILQVSGLRVTYDPYGDPEQQVKEVLVGSQPLELERTYTVASTDWEFGELTEYTHLDQKDVAYDVPTILREAMEEHAAQHSPISVSVEGRIHPL